MQVIQASKIKEIFLSHYAAEIVFADDELPDSFEVDDIPASVEHMVREWIRAGELPEYSTFEALLFLAREGWIEKGLTTVA